MPLKSLADWLLRQRAKVYDSLYRRTSWTRPLPTLVFDRDFSLSRRVARMRANASL